MFDVNDDGILPSHILESSPEFVDFFNTFLEYIEQSNFVNVQNKIEVDSLFEEFVSNIKAHYASDIPFINPVRSLSNDEIKNVLRNTIKMNQNKGTVHSIRYLFRVLFDEEVEVEYGRYGTYSVNKPFEYEITPVDENDQPISDFNFHRLSWQPFYVTNEQDRRGFAVTYFYDGEDKIWCVPDTVVNDGEILFFYNVNSRVRVDNTNMLELDGWESQFSRWKDDQDFYVLDEYNPLIYILNPKEINGFKILQVDDVTHTVPGEYVLKYVDGQLAIIKEPDWNPTTEQLRNYNIVGHTEDGTEYTMELDFKFTSVGTIELLVNGSLVDTEGFVHGRTLLLNATNFYDQFGNPAVTEETLEQIKNLISAFTIIFRTNISPEIYFEILRMTVLPAGFRLIHLFYLISTAMEFIKPYVVQPTPRTPLYNLISTRFKDIPFNPREFDRTSMLGWNYGFYNIHEISVFELESFSDPVRYETDRLYEISTSQVKSIRKDDIRTPASVYTPVGIGEVKMVPIDNNDDLGWWLNYMPYPPYYSDADLDGSYVVLNNWDPYHYEPTPVTDLETAEPTEIDLESSWQTT